MADPKKEVLDTAIEGFRSFLKEEGVSFLFVATWEGKETAPKVVGHGDPDALEALYKFLGETLEDMY